MNSSLPARILVIDAHPYSRLATIEILKLEAHQILESDGDTDILAEVCTVQPDLILMDLTLPNSDSLLIAEQLKQHPRTAIIPLILVTAIDDTGQRRESRRIGAEAYLLKPLERVELLTRVDLLIQKKRLTEWVDQIEEVLFRVAEVVEERHPDRHSRVSFSRLTEGFATYLNLECQACQDLVFAARMHGLGTVTIPEAIILKPGKLTEEERALIQQHVIVGEKIFQPLGHRRDVGKIMRHHHERWDGSGYPDGLKGEEIPVLAQIFQILDIYDALTSDRPYKTAVSSSEAIAILREEANQGWRNQPLVDQFAAFIVQSSP